MKCHEVRLKLPRGVKEAEVAVWCCTHRGHKQHDEKRALRWRSWILEKPNRFVFNLGDDTDNALPSDPKHAAMMWDSMEDPQTSRMKMCDFWLPVAKAHRMIMSHDSNHWYRTEMATGESMAREMNIFLQNQYDPKAPALSTPHPDRLPRWGHWQALTKLVVGKQPYMIHSWHGAGGGSTPESALRKCRSMAMQHEADLYFAGHYHQKVAYQDSRMVYSANGMESEERQRTYVCTGSFLGWHDGYAERMGLPPNRRGAMVVRLAADRFDVKVGL